MGAWVAGGGLIAVPDASEQSLRRVANSRFLKILETTLFNVDFTDSPKASPVQDRLARIRPPEHRFFTDAYSSARPQTPDHQSIVPTEHQVAALRSHPSAEHK